MKRLIITLALLALMHIAFSCTIGIASGDVTSNGRPLIWKTRDIASYPDNFLKWESGDIYDFLYVRDLRDSLAWMGMNSEGFCIVNSYVQRQIDRPIFNNGSLIYHLLGNCATIDDMDSILDSLNISEQVLSGNFAVMDSRGKAAMYEISWTEIDKYDLEDSEEGFIVRTNFSLISGGDDGIERYQRSVNIIDELIIAGQLDAEHLRIAHMRDFSDDMSNEISVPFEGRWFDDRPWGYIKSNVSIARGIAASSVIMEGILNGEDSQTTTMYAALGHPAVSAFLPFWAVGDPPFQVTGFESSLYTDAVNLLKSQVFDYSENSYYLDSFDLYEEGEERLWNILLPFENDMQEAVNEFLPLWRNGTLSSDNALLLSEEWATYALTLADSASTYITNELSAEFAVVNDNGEFPLVVDFEDRTKHNPEEILWDFQNDGTYDMMDFTNPTWTYTVPGVFSVKIYVNNAGSEDEFLLEDAITVLNSPVEDENVSAKPILLGNYPNPLYLNKHIRNSTEIRFYLPDKFDALSLEIFNQKGQKVLKHNFADSLKAGENSWLWDGKMQNGKLAGSGIYLYKLTSSNINLATGRLTIIK